MGFVKAISCAIVALLSLTGAASAEKVRFDDKSLIRVNVEANNATQLRVLHDLKDEFEVRAFSAHDFLVSTSNLGQIYAYLAQFHISSTLLHSNYQSALDEFEELQSAALSSTSHLSVASMAVDDFFTAYHTNDDIHSYLSSLASRYPDMIEIRTIGQTYQKNNQYAYVITSPDSGSDDKPVILLEGGIHAREWIAHAVVTYFAATLVEGYNTTSPSFAGSASSLLDSFTFVLIPVVNVDGYLYTWSTDRTWRKTRTPTKNPLCIGADPNRNWDSHWCEEGASTSACADDYCGSAPFSEPCVRNVANFILSNLTNVVSFIDFHSYSQLWMRPYGYTNKQTTNAKNQQAAAQAAVKAIKLSSKLTYQEGSIYTIIYPASGSSADWGYDTAKIAYPYGVELRDTGRYGFLLPPNQIIPCGDEIVAAVQAMANYISQHQETADAVLIE